MSRLICHRCPDCGGHDIGFTASLSWDVETQKFYVEDVYDADRWCRDCICPDDDDDLAIQECEPIVEVSDDGGVTWRDEE